MVYIALLRGINVGGNNKVSMPKLKACFELAGMEQVTTYINSGNVLFVSAEKDIPTLTAACEAAIEKQFGFRITCSVITKESLENSLLHAPRWWSKEADWKHNAIFCVAPITTAEVMNSIGNPKSQYENVAAVEPIIFWSAPIATFGRTQYSKIVGSDVYKFVTIRNANTTKKLLELAKAYG